MIKIRLAANEDFDFFFKLKSEDFNVFWAGGADKPDKNNLAKFFYEAVKNAAFKEKRKIYIIENEDNQKVGHLYINPDGSDFELACAICSEFCGRGYAKQAIKAGLEEGEKLGFNRMVSYIREDNIASMKAYSACGVKITEEYKNVFIPKLKKDVKMFKIIYEFGEKF